MKAVRIHRFCSPGVIVIDDLQCPTPGPRELLIRVLPPELDPGMHSFGNRRASWFTAAAHPGIRLVRRGRGRGARVTEFKTGERVYGVTNKQFCETYAEYALA